MKQLSYLSYFLGPKRIYNVDVGWPGVNGDARIWRRSEAKVYIEGRYIHTVCERNLVPIYIVTCIRGGKASWTNLTLSGSEKSRCLHSTEMKWNTDLMARILNVVTRVLSVHVFLSEIMKPPYWVTAFFGTGYTGHTVVGPELHGAELGVEGVPHHVEIAVPQDSVLLAYVVTGLQKTWEHCQCRSRPRDQSCL